MRNKRLIIALLAAITFGLIAAVSVKQYLLSAQTFNRTNDVVVANDQRATAGSGQRRDVRRGEARTYDKTSGRQLAERIKSRGRAARAKKR